jgi:uncharacterized HAD superfamily protein
LKIGIDIDDTITNSSIIFIKYAIEYNKKYKIEHKIDTTQLDQNKAFGWNKFDQKRFLKEYLSKIFDEVTPNKNSVWAINNLKKQGNKIYFITARNEKEAKDTYTITKKWLVKNRINYDELIINCFNKSDICKEKNVDIFIDDNFDNCLKVYNENKINVFMFNTNYNIKYNSDNIVRVFDWMDIYNKIKEKEKNEKK